MNLSVFLVLVVGLVLDLAIVEDEEEDEEEDQDDLSVPGKSKCHVSISAFGSHRAAAAGKDNKLPTVDRVGSRRSVAACRQFGLPQ
jgi:hypothetical protein